MQWVGRCAPRLRGPIPHAAAHSGAAAAEGAAGDFLVPPQAEGDRGKYTIVLDMDETLLHSRGPIVPYASPKLEVIALRFPHGGDVLYSIIRPYAARLIETLAPHAELVLWTAGQQEYARTAMRHLDPQNAIRHSIYRDLRWFSMPNYVKDLRRLGRPLDRTLLVDNSAHVCARDAANAIVIDDFVGLPEDDLLPRLEALLRALIASGEPVPQFLLKCRAERRLGHWGGFHRLSLSAGPRRMARL